MTTLPLSHPPLDRFIGRAREVVELTTALEHSNLVTVVGPPGVGKTRLALEVAANSNSEVIVVELAPVTEPSGVVGTLASALGVKQCNDVALEESITVSLAGRHVLVVLDNCEHLVEPCRILVEQLSTAGNSSGLTLLATSREPLGANRETTYRLNPLSVPPAELAGVAAIASHEAAALFVERAALADPGFALNDTNAVAVAEICRHLDGIPLAIELAAARANLLTPEQLASMLAERFNVLGQTSPTGISHHQTMEAAVAWSYGLLSPSEKVLMRRLSVFSGSTASAAEQVCAGLELSPDEVAGLLAQLGARSLVTVDRSDFGVRYRQLQAVRHFAAGKLVEAQEAVEARNRHAHWATDLAERAEPEITGPDQDGWLNRLDVEADNLRSAMAWLIHDEQLEAALRLGGALILWWRARGRAQEGRNLMMDAFQLDQMVESKAVLAKALWGAGYLDYVLGTAYAEWELCVRALDRAYEAGDDSMAARALLTLAASRMAGRDTPDNLRMLEGSCRLAHGEDSWCLAHALALRGSLTAQSLGDEVEGRRLVEEAVAVARDAGDTQSLIYALGCLSILVIRSGSPSAEAIVEEALALCHDRPHERASALLHLGRLRARRGDVRGAEAALEESAEVFRRLGNPDPAYEVWVAQARVARARGEQDRARRLLLEAKARLDRRNLVAAEVFVELAYMAVDEGRIAAAQDLADEAMRWSWAPGETVALLLCQVAVWCARGRTDEAAEAAAKALEAARGADNEMLVGDCIEAVRGLALRAGDAVAEARLRELTSVLRESNSIASPGWSPTTTLDEAAAVVSQVLDRLAPTEGRRALTGAETSVADLVAEGLTNKGISERLAISPHTVRGHVSQIFAKLDVASRAELGRHLQVGAPDAPTPDNSESDSAVPPTPLTLDEFMTRFPDDDACLEWLWRARYAADGVHARCTRCDRTTYFHRYDFVRAQRRWSCGRCKSQIRPTAGTVFHGSTTPLVQWFYAAYLLVATDCAMSAKQLQREIGISYKAAWRTVDLIRRQLADTTPAFGTVAQT